MTPTPPASSSPLPTLDRDRPFWRLAEDIPLALTWKLMAISTFTPLLLWWLLSASNWISDKFLPSPIDVVQALITLWDRGLLLQDTQASIVRVTLGFLLAAIVATPIGILMGAFASIRALLEPAIGILRYMPAPAFVPLLIIYLGIDEAPKIALIFIGTVFFNTLMIMDAGKFVPKALIETAYTLGGSRWQILSQVIWPYIIPNVLDIFRVNMAASWNLVVVAELIAASEGLGKRIELARKFLNTDEIFACLIVLGLIGFVIDLSFRILIRKTCAWSLE
ncbi:MAG: ABC transporter permease [Oscillatoriales cyanobacterium]|jgi:NitT/TauT family transport system permease protein|nr:MAG: ABC transporter permease [Oscillatoriales cyanobacterium]